MAKIITETGVGGAVTVDFVNAFCHGSRMLPTLHTLLFRVRGLGLDIGEDVMTMKTKAGN